MLIAGTNLRLSLVYEANLVDIFGPKEFETPELRQSFFQQFCQEDLHS